MLSSQLKRASQILAKSATRRTFHTTPTVLKVTEISNFTEFRSQPLKDKISFVDFYATWCGPCKAISPIVEKLSETYGDNVGFYKVDVDNVQDVAMEYGVSAMPTFLLFRDGEKAFTIVGANPNGIKQALDAAVKGDI